MSEQKHTPEPWSHTDNSWEISTIYDSDSNIVCEVEIDSEVTAETQEKFEALKKANARRIVACVNACQGLTTAHLVRFKTMLGTMEQASRIERQRDELLAALSLCLPELRGWMSCHGEDIGTIEAIKAANRAIANAKGSA